MPPTSRQVGATPPRMKLHHHQEYYNFSRVISINLHLPLASWVGGEDPRDMLVSQKGTLPKPNITPETGGWETIFLFGNTNFQVRTVSSPGE